MSALRFGPLAPAGYALHRSGLRWLAADGARIDAREVFAFCNLALRPVGGAPDPFAAESFDFQVGFASPVAGVLRHGPGLSHGAFLDWLNSFVWEPDAILARIEGADGDTLPRLLFAAGRRMSEVVEERSGLLTGWHDRARGWWGEGAGPTLLGLGTCELIGTIRGERRDFAELFAAADGPAQAMVAQDEPLVACAAVLAEGLARTDVERAAIRADMAEGVFAGQPPPAPDDYVFLGALLAGLERSPIAEGSALLTRAGLEQAGPPDAIALTLTSEIPRVARHRRLGYTLAVHDHRLRRVGPAAARWLRANFEPVLRTPDDIARDYAALLDAIRGQTGALVIAATAISTQNYEDVRSYAGLPEPLALHSISVRAKTLNLMLHDLARSHGLALLDADAIAAEMGMRPHLPDGVHPSGALQTEVRGELRRVLRGRGVAGFG